MRKLEENIKCAKNLLLDKNCYTCKHFNSHPYDGDACMPYNRLFPPELTCKDWKPKNG